MRFRLVVLAVLFALPVLAGPKTHFVGAGTVRGAPEIEPNKVVGFYLWADKDGLHLRWTTDGTAHLFSGRLDLDKPLKELVRVREVAGGWARMHGNRVVMFSSTSRGAVDGLDLVIPAGRKVRLEIQVDGKDPLPEQVLLGAKGNNPKGFPLTITYR
jgi:hypothetical protein